MKKTKDEIFKKFCTRLAQFMACFDIMKECYGDDCKELLYNLVDAKNINEEQALVRE
jgi:hypothetical protein